MITRVSVHSYAMMRSAYIGVVRMHSACKARSHTWTGARITEVTSSTCRSVREAHVHTGSPWGRISKWKVDNTRYAPSLTHVIEFADAIYIASDVRAYQHAQTRFVFV